MSIKIGIIIGSTRPGRVGDKIAQWYLDKVKDNVDATFSIVDISDFNLPLLDEPAPASYGQYSHPHTKNWAKEIAKYDAFVWITPEYNHAPAPSLLNAISFLYSEWVRKPVALVSYGSMGGVRAAEHLRHVAGEFDMVDIRSQVTIRQPWAMYDENGQINHELVAGEPEKQIEDLLWWAKAIKEAK